MSPQRPCVHSDLARGPLGSVEACSCGAVHLCLGPFSLRLDPPAFLSLCDLVDRARARLFAEARAVPPWTPPAGDPS
ncbi:MAG: hypothetical protein ACOZNI_06980 [Myxococcota bacterium]